MQKCPCASSIDEEGSFTEIKTRARKPIVGSGLIGTKIPIGRRHREEMYRRGPAALLEGDTVSYDCHWGSESNCFTID